MTVRACSGFISKCGLINGKGKRNSELAELVEEAFEAYKQYKTRPELAERQRTLEGSHGVVPVHFLGVWDTVVALGFPSRTDVAGVVSGMLRAQKYGLKFEDGALQAALNDSNAHGRMYNSVDSAGVIYRYHPRRIEDLCAGRMNGDIRLHRSVLERISHRTANYAPGQLPGKYTVIDDDPDAMPESRNPDSHADWNRFRSEIDGWVYKRKCLYERMLTFLLAFLAAGLFAWIFMDKPVCRTGLLGYIADSLNYIVPRFLEPLVHWMIYNPWIWIVLVPTGIYYFNRMKEYRANTVKACEDLRHLIIAEEEKPATDSE